MTSKVSIILLSSALLLSWIFFIVAFLNLSRENLDVRISHEVESQLDDTQELVNTLWDERAFKKEIKENLTYYLPEDFSGKVIYLGLTPLDLELGQAQVEFMYQSNKYSVDFAYYYNQGNFKVERKSPIRLVKEN